MALVSGYLHVIEVFKTGLYLAMHSAHFSCFFLFQQRNTGSRMAV